MSVVTEKPVSAKQYKFIWDLVEARRGSLEITDVTTYMQENIAGITSRDASKVIDFLKNMDVRDLDKKPQDSGLDLKPFAETYGMARKWAGKTYHTIRVADPALETRVRIKVSYSPDTGWVNVTDASDYHGQEHPKKIGSQRPTGTYNGDVADVLERVVADPAGALKAYAEITGNCSVCQRPLEDPESILRGMGAICWGKVGGSLPKEYVEKVEAQVKEVTDNA